MTEDIPRQPARHPLRPAECLEVVLQALADRACSEPDDPCYRRACANAAARLVDRWPPGEPVPPTVTAALARVSLAASG